MSSPFTLIFTDLDGTLLDHYTYESTAAASMLEQVKRANIPVILCSSKTFSELNTIQQELKLEGPFIVENGAAIYIPKVTFNQQPPETIEQGDYWLKSFCPPVQQWLSLLETLPSQFSGQFRGFSSLSTLEIAKLTGLTTPQANQAKQRQYGEPIQWQGDAPTKQAFVRYLRQRGATVLEGGRFIHVSGASDKGRALSWLSQCYQNNNDKSTIQTIALGDGNNDIAMLEAATFAIQVRSPVHDFPPLTRQHKTIKTTHFGPSGWAEAIQALLFKETQPHSLTHLTTR